MFFTSENLETVLHSITSALQAPVILLLLLMMLVTVILIGITIGEYFTERRHLREKLPALVDRLRAHEVSTAESIAESRLIKHQKAALTELTLHPELSNSMREELAIRLISEEQSRYDRRVKVTDLIARLGPMLGLMGTLIPLGPGVIALGKGDTSTLSDALLTAFDTTVAGLICAAVAIVISGIRKNWYGNYMSVLETLMGCVLEAEKTDD